MFCFPWRTFLKTDFTMEFDWISASISQVNHFRIESFFDMPGQIEFAISIGLALLTRSTALSNHSPPTFTVANGKVFRLFVSCELRCFLRWQNKLPVLLQNVCRYLHTTILSAKLTLQGCTVPFIVLPGWNFPNTLERFDRVSFVFLTS